MAAQQLSQHSCQSFFFFYHVLHDSKLFSSPLIFILKTESYAVPPAWVWPLNHEGEGIKKINKIRQMDKELTKEIKQREWALIGDKNKAKQALESSYSRQSERDLEDVTEDFHSECPRRHMGEPHHLLICTSAQSKWSHTTAYIHHNSHNPMSRPTSSTYSAENALNGDGNVFQRLHPKPQPTNALNNTPKYSIS